MNRLRRLPAALPLIALEALAAGLFWRFCL